jgi:crotonobetainyl-CoA:carnitine CoA-transferase CaiB-like acyl-CoA transferase
VIRVDKRVRQRGPLRRARDRRRRGALYSRQPQQAGITLDLMKAGREVVRRLVARADVVVANLPPQTLAAMGLDWPTLAAQRPTLVLTTISAFGSGGPYSHKLGFDGIGQAMSGGMYLSGTPGEPMKAYVPWVDFGSAGLAAFATVAALYARKATGLGQHVEGSLLQTALSVSNAALVEQRVRKLDRVATGTAARSPGRATRFAPATAGSSRR